MSNDDVIRNLLPKYSSRRINLEQYAADIGRILHAFKTDSTAQKEKLISSLKLTRFVMAKEAADGSSILRWPDHVYLATARLKELFAGVPGIYIVDDSQDCLRGEEVRELLEACGATRYICPVELNSGLSDDEKYELRLARGHVSATYEKPIEDYGLRGLPALLQQLATLDPEVRIAKARLLWEALIELQDRRGQSVFNGTYRWQYHQWRSASFDSLFIRQLNGAAWVPDAEGELEAPSAVLFDPLGWPADPFLISRIHFKKPIVEELARAAGFEPGVLDMLMRLGLTSRAELMARLNVDDLIAQPASHSPEPGEDEDAATAAETANDNRGEPADEEKGSSEERSQGSNGGSAPRGATTGGGQGQQVGATGEDGKDDQSPAGTGQKTTHLRTATRFSASDNSHSVGPRYTGSRGPVAPLNEEILAFDIA
jgi:hypothetical protein